MTNLIRVSDSSIMLKTFQKVAHSVFPFVFFLLSPIILVYVVVDERATEAIYQIAKQGAVFAVTILIDFSTIVRELTL